VESDKGILPVLWASRPFFANLGVFFGTGKSKKNMDKYVQNVPLKTMRKGLTRYFNG